MIGTRKMISIDGQQLSYLEHGSGNETVLFLHGWGGSAASFQELWVELVALGYDAGKRFIALDAPGFGESAEPSTPWEVRTYLECVVKFLNSQNIANFSIIVHSFGGRILAKMLDSEYKNRCDKAIFIAPAVARHEKTGLKQVAMMLKKVFELPLLRSVFPLVRNVGYRLTGGHDYLEVSGVMKETFKLVTQEDQKGHLTGVTTPTLVFWGTNDTYVPVSDADMMEREMQNVTKVIFPDGRHGIHRTHAAEIAAHIVKF